MLEYFRMVGKGGKEKEEKTLESEPGNKPIDTASLIAALHPFGQGGVKFAPSTKLWTMFPTSVVLALSCPLALHKRVNMVIICMCLPSKGCSADKLVLLLVPTKVSLCLNIHSQSAPQQHVSCSVSCCVFQMSPKSCLMLDPSAALKAIQHKTRTRIFFTFCYQVLKLWQCLTWP